MPAAGDQPDAAALTEAVDAMTRDVEPLAVSGIELLNSYAIVFVCAFIVTLLATPVVRMLALRANVTDLPDNLRKAHTRPIPHLGGIAVFLGLLVALAVSYLQADPIAARFRPVPIAFVLGMVAITVTGLADDIWGWDPRLKVAGQLVAAAALAMEGVGVKVAAGVLRPLSAWVDPLLGSQDLVFHVPVPGGEISIDCVYWAGTAVIALFVVGGCNAANLIDGLDGLLSGVVAVVAIGLLCISLMLAFHPPTWAVEDESLSGARIVLCLALLGAVLGFLPHNFNPASIFLGDGGSQLLGYVCVVIILMLGEWGQTHLVIAGLIVFAVPIMDTILAIVRRRLAGRPMSSADDQHVHHQLKRGLGGVKPAVFAMYGVSAAFAAVGVALAALVTLTRLRVRVVYAVVLVLFGFIAVIAVKAARKQAEKLPARRTVPASAAPPPPVASEPARRPTPANTP
jgi:UDP-GlcNAc:undecaprenyl-phosphate GlcNAc-1-phosphate transferase